MLEFDCRSHLTGLHFSNLDNTLRIRQIMFVSNVEAKQSFYYHHEQMRFSRTGDILTDSPFQIAVSLHSELVVLDNQNRILLIFNPTFLLG